MILSEILLFFVSFISKRIIISSQVSKIEDFMRPKRPFFSILAITKLGTWSYVKCSIYKILRLLLKMIDRFLYSLFLQASSVSSCFPPKINKILYLFQGKNLLSTLFLDRFVDDLQVFLFHSSGASFAQDFGCLARKT